MNIWLFFLCMFFILLALVLSVAWFGSSLHNIGYRSGHEHGFDDGYAAGYQRAMQEQASCQERRKHA